MTAKPAADNERLGADRYIAPAAMPGNTTTAAHELPTYDGATVSGLLRQVPGATTVAFLMHPRQDFSHHVLVPELLSQGYAVWTQGTRSVNNDLSLLHEQALLDMAAGYAFLRTKGFESVIGIGHSGGAALATYYAEQTSLPPAARVSDTPSGRPVPLGEADMPVPDGLMLMAPHVGQGLLLLRMIDPSVNDERDPLSIDSSLDPYNSANGFCEPPESSAYSPDFVAAYRQAQRARVQRIDDEARLRVADSRTSKQQWESSGDPRDRRRSLATTILTVYRTDADLRSVDLRMDPNERPYGSLFGRRPDLTNYGLIGFGRLTTPEAWLSTWSGLSSRADLVRCARGVRLPVLVVELTGDQACFPTDAQAITAAFPGDNVTHVKVAGRHFGAPLVKGGTSGATLAGRAMTQWLGRYFPTAGFVSVEG